MENLSTCPVCKNNSLQHFLNVKDHSLTQETFTLTQCKDCGFIFTNPRPAENEIGKYYQFEEYISHTNTNKGLVNRVYQWVRNYTLGKKQRLISELNKGKGTIADIGCGTGHFLELCKEKGWTIDGSEPDDSARKIAEDQTQQSLKKNLFDLKGTYQIITMWHVLEHVHELDKSLTHISQKLQQNGHLIIAVPNHRSGDATAYKEHWAAYDVPRHLYHFNKDTIQKLLNRFGFTLVKVKPMMFDSVYVSMLSEKYERKEKASMLRAVYRGMISNLKGFSSGEYSSHIYIFKKK